MKYLKRFENLNSLTPEEVQFHLGEIKDLFQDYIDEYNIDELPDDLDEDDDSKPGIYYHISDFSEIADKFRRPNGHHCPSLNQSTHPGPSSLQRAPQPVPQASLAHPSQ